MAGGRKGGTRPWEGARTVAMKTDSKDHPSSSLFWSHSDVRKNSDQEAISVAYIVPCAIEFHL